MPVKYIAEVMRVLVANIYFSLVIVVVVGCLVRCLCSLAGVKDGFFKVFFLGGGFKPKNLESSHFYFLMFFGINF